MRAGLPRTVLLLWLWLACAAWAHSAQPANAALTTAAPTCSAQITSVHATRSAAEAPNLAGADAPPAHDWQPVSLPDNWRWRWPGYDGIAWYRIVWTQSCTGPAHAALPATALTIDSISMAGEVFSNRDLLWRDQHLSEPLSRSWNSPRYWVLPAASLQAPGSANTLWVRVRGVAAQSPGMGVVKLGPPEDLLPWHERNHWRSRTLFLLNLTISATLGVMALCIWLPGRKHPVFGWFALVSLSWVLFGTHVLMTGTWPFPHTLAMARASSALYFVFVGSFCLFTWRLTEHPTPAWLEKGLGTLTASGILLAALSPGWDTLDLLGHVFTVLFIGNAWYIVWHAVRTRRKEHLLLAASLLLMTLIGLRDALTLLGIWDSRDFYGPYTCLLFLFMSAWLMRQRILRDTQRIERFNQELTETVDRACTELSTTLSQEHSLALSNAQLQERLQLAHDLHDGLGGQIVRSIMLVEETTTPLHKDRFLAMLKLLRDDLRQVVDSDASASTAVPPTPEEWTIPLRYRFVTLFDELDIQSQWRTPPAWQTPPSALQCMLLARVTEEALTNIVKHSHARAVCVSLHYLEPHKLVLRIEDDGVGFHAPAVLRTGMGIGMSSMRARMERLGGHLDVRSCPGATVIEATLRLDQPLHIPMAPAAMATDAPTPSPAAASALAKHA